MNLEKLPAYLLWQTISDRKWQNLRDSRLRSDDTYLDALEEALTTTLAPGTKVTVAQWNPSEGIVIREPDVQTGWVLVRTPYVTSGGETVDNDCLAAMEFVHEHRDPRSGAVVRS